MPYYTYIMSNAYRTVLYIGMTNNLVRRVSQHKAGEGSIFSSDNNCYFLVHYEEFNDVRFALAREKQLKNWKREWKEVLIRATNPLRKDLSEQW